MAEKNIKSLEGEILQQLQETLYAMYTDISRACEAHGIHVMLGGGTLLGAVRYQDMIPWDDDLDLMIMRDDYDEFLLAMDDLAEDYSIQKPEHQQAVFPFLKVRKRNTCYIEMVSRNFPQDQGIFIDVFVVEKCPNNPLIRRLHGLRCNLSYAISASAIKREYVNPDYVKMIKKDWKKYCLYRLRNGLSYLFAYRSALKWQYRTYALSSKYAYLKNNHYVSIPSGRRKYFGELEPREVFDGVSELKFRDWYAYGPKQVETYLINNYGSDYLVPPPISERESHGIDYLSFDVLADEGGSGHE